jgi:hypothetical protein
MFEFGHHKNAGGKRLKTSRLEAKPFKFVAWIIVCDKT